MNTFRSEDFHSVYDGLAIRSTTSDVKLLL